MVYTLRYYNEFTSLIYNRLVRIEILQRDYTGESEEIKMGATLNLSDSGDGDLDLVELVCPLPKEMVALLSSLTYKGNLRELRSIAARFACLCDKNEVGNHEYLMETCRSCCHVSVEQLKACVNVDSLVVEPAGSLAVSIKEAEKTILSLSKISCGGSLSLMAERLQLGRTTLWRKLMLKVLPEVDH